MGWLKELLGTDENKYTKMLKSSQEKETLEKEFQALPDMGRMATTDDKERAEIDRIEDENAQQLEPARAEREKEFQAALDQLLVIDGAKLECPLCTNPQGILKVNFDTPTTQDKKTATIKEKDASSLIFMGNCKKSPKSSSPCASVMKLGEWKDTGNMKIQDQPPLLLKSNIPCLYGGSNIKITDSGQINEPSDIEIMPIEYKKDKQILSMAWMCAETQEEIKDAIVGDQVSILLKTRNYNEGETISIKIKEVDGLEIREGEKEVTFEGTVLINGYAELKEKFEIENVNKKAKANTSIEA